MRSIMPSGYSLHAKQKRLESELRQARAVELAGGQKATRPH
jgi:hypothetical protein